MPLREEFESSGNWLFRWRSYLPLLMLSLTVIALRNFKYVYYNELFDKVWELVCLALSFIGIGIRVYTVSSVPKGTSGRNTKGQVADTLNTTGIYSILRHPLYFGNFLVWFGIVVSVRSYWFTAIAVLIFWLYYERIMFAEEEFLRRKFGKKYLAWSARTPAFFPKFKNWKRSDRSFNLLAGIGSEYSTVFMTIVLYAVLDILEDRIVQGHFSLDGLWTPILAIGLAWYLVVRFFKKRTKLLNKL